MNGLWAEILLSCNIDTWMNKQTYYTAIMLLYLYLKII